MILLESIERAGPPRVFLIFGAGLLGSAIERSLRARHRFRRTHFPLHWSEEESQKADLETLERALGEKIQRNAALGIVWSAGRAGFSTTAEDAEEELRSFRSVVRLADRLSDSVSRGRAHFLLLSSAGGLFEGQRHIEMRSRPLPRRPYGMLKLEEERILATLDSTVTRSVLRISSAYGYVRLGHRSGLIPTLVANGIRRQVTTIVGTMSTLRDFVWTGDVADFAASRLLDDTHRGLSTEFLACGRPSSIFEVQKIVEDRLRAPIFVSYVPEGPNRDDITFSRSLLPLDWHPSDLRTNVHRVIQEALGLHRHG